MEQKKPIDIERLKDSFFSETMFQKSSGLNGWPRLTKTVSINFVKEGKKKIKTFRNEFTWKKHNFPLTHFLINKLFLHMTGSTSNNTNTSLPYSENGHWAYQWFSSPFQTPILMSQLCRWRPIRLLPIFHHSFSP